jgi:hypothetical protein
MLLRAQEGNSSDPLLEMLSSLGKSQDDDSSAKNSDDSAALLKELLVYLLTKRIRRAPDHSTVQKGVRLRGYTPFCTWGV